jgi:hypothetical protein
MSRMLRFPALIAAYVCLSWGLAVPVAGAAGGPIIPAGAYGGSGVTGPSGLPSSEFRYLTLDTHDGRSVVEKIATDGGQRVALRSLDGSWALPAVTIGGEASGLSADGSTLVLIQPGYDRRADETRLMALDADRGPGLRAASEIVLDGRFSFDAISPQGDLLYLVQYENPRDPLDYRVRAYDLATHEFRPGSIVDPEEPDEQMTGQPVARESSPDGRWAYTLYGGGDETFIHALDTQDATAACIDLPQFGPRALYSLGLAVDASTGNLVVSDRHGPAATVDFRTFEVGPPPAKPQDKLAGGVGQSPDEPTGGGVPAWPFAFGAAVIAGGAYVLVRRRRRQHLIDEEELDRLVAFEAEQSEKEPEWEPVP